MKRMRGGKLALVLLCAVLCLSGCAGSPTGIAPEVDKYLGWLHVFDSQITSCEIKQLSHFEPEVYEETWANITENMETLNQANYKIREKEAAEPAEDGDVVTLELSLQKDGSWTSAGEADMIAGIKGTLWPALQKKLIGKKKGEAVTLKVPKKGSFVPEAAGQKIRLKVVRICAYTLKSGGKRSVTEAGVGDGFELYEYLFNKRWEDEQLHQIAYRKQQFLQLVKSACTFSIADEDIENYGYQLAKEQRLIAAGQMMPFEYYYTVFLQLDKDGFYEESASQALEGIKRILWVGAAAQKLKLSVSEKDLTDFCKENGINRQELQTKQYDTLRYYLLEDKVMTHFLGEEGANVWIKKPIMIFYGE